MKAFLLGLLPRILPEGVPFRLISHEGKQDLERSIPRKLRAWQNPEARFVVVRDQDSGDCVEIKRHLERLCADAGRADTLVRIVCHELEAWYLADLRALDQAFGTRLAAQQNRSKYRNPDRALVSPNRELKALVPGFGKVTGARALGPLVEVDNQRSPSFAHFVRGVRLLASRRAGA